MTHPIITFSDFLCAIDETSRAFQNHAVWWRGHAVDNWQLIPSVFRGLTEQGEKQLVGQFVQKAEVMHEGQCPSRGDEGEWLFFMQHYGVPTRLLDWTESPLVAAFFSSLYQPEYIDKSGSLWALNPGALNGFTINLPGEVPYGGEKVKPLLEAPFKKSPPEGSSISAVAVGIPLSNKRMWVQRGTCTIHGLRCALETTLNDEKILRKYEILPSAKEEINQWLRRFSISESYLFPDLDHLAKDITENTRRRFSANCT